MAKSVISGLTITIGANTKEFQDKIKEIDRVSKDIAKDLKTVSESMKLDPTAIQTYSDKFKLLQAAVENSKKKVDMAQQAIEALNKDLAENKVSPEEYAKSLGALEKQLESAEYEYEKNVSAIRNYTQWMRNASESEKTLETATKDSTETVEKAGKAYLLFYEQTSKAKDAGRELADSISQVKPAYTMFYEQTSKAKDANKELVDSIYKAKPTYEVLYEQTSRAADANKDLDDSINKTNKAYTAFYQETGKSVDLLEDYGKTADDAADKTEKLSETINLKLIGTKVVNGFKNLVGLAKNLVTHLVDAAKKLYTFSESAVSMAGQWNDAVETSKRAFGEYADNAVHFAETQGKIYGIYSGDMLVAMNNLGLMFSAMDIGRDRALGMSMNVMNLAADLRAAFGGDINEILESLNSAFGGQLRTLKQWGVYTSQAEIKAYALEKGVVSATVDTLKLEDAIVKVKEATKAQGDAFDKYGEDSVEYERATVNLAKAEAKLSEVTEGKVDSLTSAEKAIATLLLAQERLADIEGQAVAESNKYPALVNRVNAAFDELKKKIGIELLPVFEDFLQKFLAFLDTEEGKGLISSITKAFGDLGKKVAEIAQDGRFKEMVDHLIESAPEIVTWLGDMVEKVLELAPKLSEMADGILGILDAVNQFTETGAWLKAEKQVEDFAKSYGVSTEQMELMISEFARKTQLSLTDVYNNWETYEPMVVDYIDKIPEATGNMADDIRLHLDNAAKDTEEFTKYRVPSIDVSNWQRFWYGLKVAVQDLWDFLTTFFSSEAWNKAMSDEEGNKWGFGSIGGDWGGFGSMGGMPHAMGGPAYAGRVYRVNDDAGHRPEMFIPNTDGYILNGNQVDRIVNNNHSSNYSGGINIYVNSYGMNVAEVADELGAAFSQRIRKSGAML